MQLLDGRELHGCNAHHLEVGSRADTDRVVTELVTGAHATLTALDGAVLNVTQTEAVGLLALVAGQGVEPGDCDGTWRIAPVTRPVTDTDDPATAD